MKKIICVLGFITLSFLSYAQTSPSDSTQVESSEEKKEVKTNYKKEEPAPKEKVAATSSSDKPAKQSSDTPFYKKLRFGGNIGGSFGSNGYIEVSPIIGYQVNPKFLVATGVSYYRLFDVDENMWAWRGLARYHIIPAIFLQGEYELINYPSVIYSSGEVERDTRSNVMFGGGLVKGRASITAMYIVNYDDEKTPYSSPWIIRFGVIL